MHKCCDDAPKELVPLSSAKCTGPAWMVWPFNRYIINRRQRYRGGNGINFDDPWVANFIGFRAVSVPFGELQKFIYCLFTAVC